MFRKVIIHDSSFDIPPRSSTPMFLLPGITLIVLGILILIMPELLVVLVAAFFILTGIALLVLGNNMRRMSRYFPPQQ